MIVFILIPASYKHKSLNLTKYLACFQITDGILDYRNYSTMETCSYSTCDFKRKFMRNQIDLSCTTRSSTPTCFVFFYRLMVYDGVSNICAVWGLVKTKISFCHARFIFFTTLPLLLNEKMNSGFKIGICYDLKSHAEKDYTGFT